MMAYLYVLLVRMFALIARALMAFAIFSVSA